MRKLFFYMIFFVSESVLASEDLLSLEDIIGLVDNNPILQEARFSYEQSFFDVEVSKQYQNPTIDFTSETQHKQAVSVAFPIERSELRETRINASINAAESKKYAYEAIKKDVLIDLLSSYFYIFQKIEEKSIADQEVVLLEKIFDVVAHEVSRDEVPEYDLTKTEAELNESKSTLAGAEDDLLKAKQMLGEKLGIEHTPEIKNNPLETGKYLSCVIDEDKAEEKFLNNSLYMSGLYNNKKEEQTYLNELEQQKLQPTLLLSKEVDMGIHNQIIGISLPLPLFHNREAQVSSAKSRVNYSKSALDSIVRSFNLDYEQNSTNYTSSKKMMVRYENILLTSSEHSFNVAQKAYKDNKINFVDLIDAYRLYISSQYAYVKNKFEVVQSCIALKRYE